MKRNVIQFYSKKQYEIIKNKKYTYFYNHKHLNIHFFQNVSYAIFKIKLIYIYIITDN